MATPTVVLLPVWGAGHLMPMLEFGKRLLTSNNNGSGRALSVTVLVMRPPADGQHASEFDGDMRRAEAAAAGLDVRFHRLPAVDPPTDHAGPVEFVSRVVELHASHVRAALSTLACPVAASVPDK